MEPVILTWRPQNFLTIFLMVVVIGAVATLAAQAVNYAMSPSTTAINSSGS